MIHQQNSDDSFKHDGLMMSSWYTINNDILISVHYSRTNTLDGFIRFNNNEIYSQIINTSQFDKLGLNFPDFFPEFFRHNHSCCDDTLHLPSRMKEEHECSTLSVHKGFDNKHPVIYCRISAVLSSPALTYRTQQEDRTGRGFHTKNYHLYAGTESCDLARKNKSIKRTLSNGLFLSYLTCVWQI